MSKFSYDDERNVFNFTVMLIYVRVNVFIYGKHVAIVSSSLETILQWRSVGEPSSTENQTNETTFPLSHTLFLAYAPWVMHEPDEPEGKRIK